MEINSYVQQRLRLAADELKGPGSTKEKLRRAAFRILRVYAKEFPPDFRQTLEEIHSALTGKGRVNETIDAMAEEEASLVAKNIVELERMIGNFANGRDTEQQIRLPH